jgi:hypothetical protein
MASHALAELAAHDAAFDAIESGDGDPEQHIRTHAMVRVCVRARARACMSVSRSIEYDRRHSLSGHCSTIQPCTHSVATAARSSHALTQRPLQHDPAMHSLRATAARSSHALTQGHCSTIQPCTHSVATAARSSHALTQWPLQHDPAMHSLSGHCSTIQPCTQHTRRA